ncbi:TIGR04283 family arsenosugar biosynthesis glycosyltransferase [Bizionia sp.]|uniref:TIGR04283 family arsenosugar biosynthesis glycosyltransferase n=1 Tax=Bizionia sp. TaxID=1954480 RepID=UPI003A951A60
MINSISIIIPMLNEAESIASVLEHLLENSTSKNIAEIIVVDGGSVDGSQNIVNKFVPSNKIHLLNAHKGRAKQMNFGANHATGTILYFLHADSFPPKNFDNLIIQEVTKGNLAGCFRLQFDNNHWWLQLAGWLTQFSWRASRGGDQSQFITKQLFTEIGGFDENFTIYEDNILINELYARKQFVVIQDKIKTSARLYKKHGVWTLQYHFWTIYVKKWFGASADELYTYYQKYIS